ncbi:putative ferric reductase transmembrane component 8 [Wickerhamomyces ciferrii]|uniref:Ferric reductase transmembrane component 8 n=1 Tax=Wickerhamomyces ciferrii (strain ATCC 14091 / BCRC 22168 / CBS 111 / JCM 3599 / NBRC 0793 / NRRL Y-1031 F-60-10) TaxID=1206466 RepID=K0K977_WICCF|nr:putative ferric reductase transmembrane component 8 [Wickerhamomyces ciferrii]CCH41450.1 putative ferric reductase transmembrane component 8 [Wickerhamomyces ciferrii]
MFKIKKVTNIWGIVAMVAFALIAITSLPKVRRLNFNVFYLMHYIMTWTCVISVHFHAVPGIGLYTILNVIILLVQIIYRVKNTRKTKVTVVPISPTLSLVEFPLSSISQKNVIPGGHVRINNKQGVLKDWFYTLVPLAHPYTIASLPNDPTVKLIIRKGKFPLKTNKDYYITGAFDAKLDFMREQSLLDKFLAPKRSPLLRAPLKYTIDAQRVMIVVGGSGISFGIPLLRILNYNGISARLMWVCKDIKDLNLINHFKGVQGIECYITGDVNENDINIDYLDDAKDINPVQPVDYGSFQDQNQEEDEIDFTTIGKAYKEAHEGRKSVSTKSSSDTFKEHENVNIDISNSCGYGYNSSTTMTESPSIDYNNPININNQETLHLLPHHKSIPESLNPESFKNIKIPQSVKIFYGRPNLGSEHYDWCLQSQCVGPTLRSGHNVCCRDIGEHDVDKSKIWVVAAGPTGLVDHAKQWAIDGGLRYHIESFSV